MALCLKRKNKTPTCIRGVVRPNEYGPCVIMNLIRPNEKKKTKNSLGHCATSKFWKKNIQIQGKY